MLRFRADEPCYCLLKKGGLRPSEERTRARNRVEAAAPKSLGKPTQERSAAPNVLR